MALPVAAGIIAMWPGTHGSVPTGWSRVTSLDGRYVKGAGPGSEPDASGGAATHTHASTVHTHSISSHSHTSNGSSTGFSADGAPDYGGGNAWPAYPHSHQWPDIAAASGTAGATAAPWDTASSDPPYCEVIFVASDGSPSGLPDGAVAWWDDQTPPAGWAQHAPSTGRFMKGAATSGNGGATGGSASHAHTAAAHTHQAGHTHTPAGQTSTYVWASGHGATQPTGSDWDWQQVTDHAHTVSVSSTDPIGNATSANSGTTGVLPPYRTLLAVENGSAAPSLPPLLICPWLGSLGSIPENWRLCDGTGDTPDLRSAYPRNADAPSEVGTTGGSLTHSHASPAAHVHSEGHVHTLVAVAVPSAQNQQSWLHGYDGVAIHHSHSGASASGGAGNSGSGTQDVQEATSEPPFRTVAFLMYLGEVEVTVDVPAEDAVITSPSFGVQWSLGAGVQNDYWLRVFEADGVTQLYDSGQVGSATTEHTVPSDYLRNARTYYLRVDVHDSDGASGSSDLRRITTSWTPPDPVLGVTVVPVGGW